MDYNPCIQILNNRIIRRTTILKKQIYGVKYKACHLNALYKHGNTLFLKTVLEIQKTNIDKIHQKFYAYIQ